MELLTEALIEHPFACMSLTTVVSYFIALAFERG
jgi:hypothetical protein